MAEIVYNLAFDFGASSGRLVLSKYENDRITLSQIHRFSNEPVRVGKRIYWDTFRIFHEMKVGLKMVAKMGINPDSIGIDTWGVDYGFLDKEGNLIGNPITYRDRRTKGIIEEVSKKISLKELYSHTGIQFMEFNTIFQLYSDKIIRPDIYEKADKILFMPELFSYFLSGVKYNEYTIASTSQLLDAKSRKWDYEIIEKLGLKKELFSNLISPGTVIGKLTKEIEDETGLKDVKVVVVGSHDTASAVCGTPFVDENAAFLSCGTWSLLGMEVKNPILSKASYEYNYTNEGGVEGKIRYLKNINGLWMIQNLKKNWSEFNTDISYPEIILAAREAINKSFRIDTSYEGFIAPLNMSKEIIDYCVNDGQGKPEGIGEIAMAIYNGLTDEYKKTIDNLEYLLGEKISCINMIGGGIQDELLCELTAIKTGKRVIAGPVEGSVLGNVIMQLIANDNITSVEEGRDIIKKSFDNKEYSNRV